MYATDFVRPAKHRLSVIGNFARRFASIVLAALLLAGCTVQLEPGYDARIVKEVETLTLETETFFASIVDGIPAAGYQEREKTYVALAGRAGAIKVYAEARPAPSGRLVDFFQNLIVIPASPKITAAVGGERETGAPVGDRYANATGGYMEDYIRNLQKLAKKDRDNLKTVGDLVQFEVDQAAYQVAVDAYRKAYADWVIGRGLKPVDLEPAPTPPQGKVTKNFVERRRVVLIDVLHDALVYERDILNRNR